MARHIEPTPEQEAGYRAWVAERPPLVRAVAERFDPWTLYRLTTTGHRVFMVGFSEPDDDGPVTMVVAVSGLFNAVVMERTVYGIRPEDLVECDLPGPEEPVGSLLGDLHLHNLAALHNLADNEGN